MLRFGEFLEVEYGPQGVLAIGKRLWKRTKITLIHGRPGQAFILEVF